MAPDIDKKIEELTVITDRLDQVEFDIIALKVEAILAGILRYSVDGVVVVSSTGKIITCNHKLEEMFGYSAKELHTQPIELLVPEEARSPHVEHRAEFRKHPISREMGKGIALGPRGRKKDGTIIPLGISLQPLELEMYTVVCAICTIREEEK